MNELLLEEHPLFLVLDHLPQDQVVNQLGLAWLNVGEHYPCHGLVDRHQIPMLRTVVPAMGHDICCPKLLAVVAKPMIDLLDQFLT